MIKQALPGFDTGHGVSWQPNRAFALERLTGFGPKAGRAYATLRNFDLGPENRSNVSALSPLIRHRLILEEEVLRETLGQHSPEEAEKFVQEVFWRGYFKGWLEHRPTVWARYCAERATWIKRLEADAALDAAYESAVRGQTGLPYFDAWSRELLDTGYLHNHARMWFASVWIFTLDLPWQLGADFFLRHLLDGDPASNTLSWRWVGGLHTPGKTYLARRANIERFTRGRFQPGDELANTAPPLWETPLEEPVPLAAGDPIDPAKPFALLVTEEDCLPEALGLPAAPAALLGWTCTELRSPLPVGERACTFANGAVDDALARGCAEYRLDAKQMGRVAIDEWAAWLEARQIDTLVMVHAPVGPVADAIAERREKWAQAGIRLVSIRRRYDDLIWPHSKKGFFALKKKIPKLLSDLGLV